jgi:hypothetical protein
MPPQKDHTLTSIPFPFIRSARLMAMMASPSWCQSKIRTWCPCGIKIYFFIFEGKPSRTIDMKTLLPDWTDK